MADYRSAFFQVWILGGDLPGADLVDPLVDLEAAARSAAADAPSSEGAIPLDVRQFLAGLGFLREHLWAAGEAGTPSLAGLLLSSDRLWAVRAGTPATLDQLTGAPTRMAWHEPANAGGLSWCELDPGEVWRLEFAGPEGALAVHHRPALVSLVGTMKDEAASDSSTPTPTAASPSPAPQVRPRSVATPRAVRPAAPWLRRPLVLGAAAALLVAALAVLATWGREPLSRAVVGRYALALETHPAGATVRIDGELVPGRTPLSVPLPPGEHRVELTYGEFATSVFTVAGERGDEVRRDVAWTGSLGLSSADTTAKLRVSLDGKVLGALPLWRDDVPVGQHRLSFQGEGIRPWEEDVKIKAGESTRITAEPVRVPDYGLVTASAERVSREGVEDVEGASVFVDGKPAGGTPLDLRLSPGPHSVRIASGAELGPVHLIDVQPGGRFFARTTFGRPAEPAVAFDPPARLSKAAPPTLVVRLAADVPLPVRRMRLFVQPGKAAAFASTDLAITRDDGRPRGAIAFPLGGLAAGATVRYYLEVETREGEEYASEIRTAVVTP